MNTIRRAILCVTTIACFVLATATGAFAQTTVRVTVDGSTIWKPGFHEPAAVVDAGAILTVVAQRKDWYEVAVPRTDDASGTTTGFIYKGLVDAGSGGAASKPDEPPTSTAPPATEQSRAFGVFGFAQFGYGRFAARNSFQAIFGTANGAFFGGGGEVRLGRLFLNASAERFRKTGQRVVVVGSQVFGLGIPDTVTLTPITGTAGWRFTHARATPYVGGGVGKILFREESGFTDAGENVDTRFTRYHVLGGVEFRNNWVATAFEVEYSRVPDAIGLAGASAAFAESNLGGVVGRIRVLVGR
jgi:hypothetical protein